VNEFVKRVRAARIHVLIMGHLQKKMPTMMGKQKSQEKMIANLEEEFYQVILPATTSSHSIRLVAVP